MKKSELIQLIETTVKRVLTEATPAKPSKRSMWLKDQLKKITLVNPASKEKITLASALRKDKNDPIRKTAMLRYDALKKQADGMFKNE